MRMKFGFEYNPIERSSTERSSTEYLFKKSSEYFVFIASLF